jgi:hypothetical protein
MVIQHYIEPGLTFSQFQCYREALRMRLFDCATIFERPTVFITDTELGSRFRICIKPVRSHDDEKCWVREVIKDREKVEKVEVAGYGHWPYTDLR